LLLAGSGLPALDHEPGELRSRARDLLSRPPYRDEPDGPVTDVIRRAREAVARFLQSVLDAVAGDTRVAWVIVAAGTVLLLVVIWRATRGFDADRRVATVPEQDPARSAREWTLEADEHSAAGRWREAVRCRYAALVAHLVEAGTIAEVPGRTVRELDEEVERAAPAIAVPVRRAGDTFDEVWYGHADAGPDDVADVAAAVAEVAARIGRVREVRA
jgi:hypothetical protein